MPEPVSSQTSEPPSRGAHSELREIQIGVGTIAMALAAFSMALFVYFVN